MVQSQETARARRIVRKRGGGAVAALQDSLDQYKKGRLEADTRLGQVVLAGDRTQADPEEEELVRVADTWAGDDGDSDCESVDSEAEESLKHAGVFTGEEVMRTMRDKLIRLQKLYIEQFGRLGHLLRESRRLYLAQVREEREAGLVSMSAQQAASPGDQLAAAKLKALTHYHSPAGREALLAARLREKRAAASGGGGAVVASSPALFSGFSLGAGYSRAVSSLGAGGWTTWPAHLDRARVAGVTLAVPSDMFQQC